MNIFEHYAHTGAGQTVAMYDVFSKSASGGSFFKDQDGEWKCCGKMIRQSNGTVVFNIWHDDSYTKEVKEGPKAGEPFKLLVYQDSQWYEVIPMVVRTAFGGDKQFTQQLFKAKAWNMMAVMKTAYITMNPTDIIPVSHEHIQ